MDAISINWKRAPLCAVAFVTLVVAACGGDGDWFDPLFSCPKVPETVGSVRVSPSSLSLRVGDQVTLGASVAGVDGNFLLCGPSTIWSSSDPAVATVNLGVVTGRSGGKAWIKAEAGGRADSSAVQVGDAPIASLTIIQAPSDFLAGQTAPLAVAAGDSAGNPLVVRTVTWASSDPAVATVSSTGMVTARNSGVATIRATVEQATATTALTISDGPPSLLFLAVSAGSRHTCALVGGGDIPDGTAYCWGYGGEDQLGTGNRASSRRPVKVSTSRTFVSIAVGMGHSCALETSGSIFCWGSNVAGELGDGTTTARTSPVRVATSIQFRRVATGGSSTCALDVEGRLYCWGSTPQGSSPPRAQTVPAPMADHLRFTDIAAGWSAMCGLTTDGRVYCWGRLNHTMDYGSPTLVSAQVTFAKFDVGEVHLCGVTAVAELYCWGQVHGYPAGTEQILSAPTLVPGAPATTHVATGGGLTCGVAGSGGYCFGSTYLQQPDVAGTMVAVPLRHGVTSVSAGSRHGCAIDTRGSAWCWGGNVEWQVGGGEDTFVTAPLQLRIP